MMSDDDALLLILDTMRKHDFTGFVLTRRDVETEAGRDLTDEEWKEVTRTAAWRKGGSAIAELGGFDIVIDAINQAGLENVGIT